MGHLRITAPLDLRMTITFYKMKNAITITKCIDTIAQHVSKLYIVNIII